MLKSISTLLVFGLAVFFTCSTSHAALTLTANLTNAGEPGTIVPTLTNGNPRPASFGTATFVINDAETAMTMTVTVNNIDFTGSQTADTNDNLLNAHIHASATVTPTTNAGVVWGFFGSPFNDTTPNDQVVTPFGGSGVGGTITGKWDATEGNGTNFAAQLNNLKTVHAYINFHTMQFTGGEIRGMLVPEPCAIALFGAGAIALLGRPGRRRLMQMS